MELSTTSSAQIEKSADDTPGTEFADEHFGPEPPFVFAERVFRRGRNRAYQAAAIQPAVLPPSVLSLHIFVMVAFTLVLFAMTHDYDGKSELSRIEGIALLAAFIAYDYWVVVQNVRMD